MLTKQEFELIVKYARDHKLTKKGTLDYIENYFLQDNVQVTSHRGKLSECMSPAKKGEPHLIAGHDEQGNPIIDTQRQDEIKGGYKVRHRKESAQSDDAK